MRAMNKIELASPHLAVLGPGSTWYDVLQEIPPNRFTMLHGQCERLPYFRYNFPNHFSHNLDTGGLTFLRVTPETYSVHETKGESLWETRLF